MLLEIDFLKYQPMLKISKTAGKTWVFDPIRRKNVVLTPEELLRQLVLCHLLSTRRYNPARVRVEMGIEVNGLQKRCDILVFDADFNPWLLIECKSPKVAFTQSVFEQASRYNLTLQVPFLVATNGLATYCCRVDHVGKTFEFLSDLPDFQ